MLNHFWLFQLGKVLHLVRAAGAHDCSIYEFFRLDNLSVRVVRLNCIQQDWPGVSFYPFCFYESSIVIPASSSSLWYLTVCFHFWLFYAMLWHLHKLNWSIDWFIYSCCIVVTYQVPRVGVARRRVQRRRADGEDDWPATHRDGAAWRDWARTARRLPRVPSWVRSSRVRRPRNSDGARHWWRTAGRWGSAYSDHFSSLALKHWQIHALSLVASVWNWQTPMTYHCVPSFTFTIAHFVCI